MEEFTHPIGRETDELLAFLSLHDCCVDAASHGYKMENHCADGGSQCPGANTDDDHHGTGSGGGPNNDPDDNDDDPEPTGKCVGCEQYDDEGMCGGMAMFNCVWTPYVCFAGADASAMLGLLCPTQTSDSCKLMVGCEWGTPP